MFIVLEMISNSGGDTCGFAMVVISRVEGSYGFPNARPNVGGVTIGTVHLVYNTTFFGVGDLVLRVDQERSDGVDGLVVGADIVVAENVGELFRQTADVRETNADLSRRGIVIGFSFGAAFRRFEDPLFVSVGMEG